MAGRIRSIKPEILDDEEAAALSDEAWRLWVSLWLLADDWGNTRAGDRYLASLVWQDTSRSKKIPAALRELVKTRRAVVYDNGGERYLHLRNWEKHQRIDNAGRPRVPGPDHEMSTPWEQSRGNSREPPRTSANLGGSPLDQRPPTSDQRPPIPTTDPDRAPGGAALSVLEHLNKIRQKAIQGSRPITANKASLEHIVARLKDGYTEDDCRHVIAVCAAEVRHKPENHKWFNTVSPFRKDNFARKLGSDPDSFAASGHARAATYGEIEEIGDMTHKLGGT
jgi:hypothetical protein